ncbi:MAG: glycoside hydrolase [Halobacteriales archaeon]|nr:glycoside hydrolase [Halobacteriales archaeon]
MRVRTACLLLALTVPVLAGCISTSQQPLTPGGAGNLPSLADLGAQEATKVLDQGPMRTFVWDAVSDVGARGPLVAGALPGGATWTWQRTFEVDRRLGYVDLQLNYTGDGNANLISFVVDDLGRTQCGGAGFSAPKGCTAPVPDNLTAKKSWVLRVQTGFPLSEPGMPFRASVTLHPRAHLPVSDPLAGVDKAIVFRVSDTTAPGSEPNVGVLADGTIFAQQGLSTMRSKDDGKTWQDVSPPTTAQASADPMLFVEPHSNTVYVDQLYVACSVLAWSTDAGQTWLTNPAACGNPGDDHQKIAAGPNPLGLPANAVYYAHSSFAQGVWVSHSYDGGLTFVTSPVVGVTDGRSYDNTGHVLADRKGNVYDPLYMCDSGGYMGLGVSHDFGQTFSFVEVDQEKGGPSANGCYDPDPGIAVDTDGTVYMAYTRPSGVKLTFSKDQGATWSAPVRVSLPSQLSWVHVDAIAGDPGKVAIAYRATSDSAKGPDDADGFAAWYMYVAFVENAASASPTVRVGMVSPPGDPEQRGQVCTTGVACVGGSRNLLDFIDIAVGPTGRVYTVYTDGCKQTCVTPADSRARLGLVGIEEQGPRLFADKAPWAAQGAGTESLLTTLS